MKFYEIDSSYLDYLRGFDKRVPEITKSGFEKFFCGIVLEINDYDYFVPVSSFTTSQATNLIIFNKKKSKRLSSLRFCFMIPIPKDKSHLLTEKDFSLITDKKYAALVSQEYQFCLDNKERILKKAQAVYKMGNDPEHPRYNDCCNFTDLEFSSDKYP